MAYLNIKYGSEVETVDEIVRDEFKTFKAYKIELREVIKSYHMNNMMVYISNRCTKQWRTN